MKIERRRVRGTGGFTLSELLVALGVLSLALSSIASMTRLSYDAYRSTRANAALVSTLQRVMNRVVAELTGTGGGVLTPNPTGNFGTEELTFQLPVGYATGAIQWGPATKIALEPEEGESDDGVDNNGNGLVDEGVLVLIHDSGGPSETRALLCHGVAEYLEGETPDGADDNGNGLIDERGLSLSRNGSLLTIRLSLLGTQPNGAVMTRTMSTSIELRN